jgi:hypothetical protein
VAESLLDRTCRSLPAPAVHDVPEIPVATADEITEPQARIAILGFGVAAYLPTSHTSGGRSGEPADNDTHQAIGPAERSKRYLA